jgi:hypothetical protein
MKLKTFNIIFIVLVCRIYGQEQFKTGNSWNYEFNQEGNPAFNHYNLRKDVSIKILNAVNDVGGSIHVTAEIKDSEDAFIDTGDYIYQNNAISSIKYTDTKSLDTSISNQFIGLLVIPNNPILDSVGFYEYSNTRYAILNDKYSYYLCQACHYLSYIKNIGLLYSNNPDLLSHSNGGYSISYSLQAFNKIPLNIDSLLQTPIKNNFQGNQSVSSPLISIKKDGSKIICQSVKFVSMARMEIIDLQGRKLISRDLVFTHNNEIASFSINQLPEGLYIVNAYKRGKSQKIVSMKIIR